jgi:hypothetical protein
MVAAHSDSSSPSSLLPLLLHNTMPHMLLPLLLPLLLLLLLDRPRA